MNNAKEIFKNPWYKCRHRDKACGEADKAGECLIGLGGQKNCESQKKRQPRQPRQPKTYPLFDGLGAAVKKRQIEVKKEY